MLAFCSTPPAHTGQPNCVLWDSGDDREIIEVQVATDVLLQGQLEMLPVTQVYLTR